VLGQDAVAAPPASDGAEVGVTAGDALLESDPSPAACCGSSVTGPVECDFPDVLAGLAWPDAPVPLCFDEPLGSWPPVPEAGSWPAVDGAEVPPWVDWSGLVAPGVMSDGLVEPG
jgi:hypothetical protein